VLGCSKVARYLCVVAFVRPWTCGFRLLIIPFASCHFCRKKNLHNVPGKNAARQPVEKFLAASHFSPDRLDSVNFSQCHG